jgi:uncharacterized protein YjbI with pentapeptide repeats
MKIRNIIFTFIAFILGWAIYYLASLDYQWLTPIRFEKIATIISGMIAIYGLILFKKRLKNQEEQIDIQIKQRVDERFNAGITLLGSTQTSARTGAIYTLYELTLEEEKYRKQIVQILCSHIRSKTSEKDYQENHKNRPSNEIQTTINLLFKAKIGLYAQDFAKNKDFPRGDLSHAYLIEVDFSYAQCQGATFMYAQCQGAIFSFAQCQGVNFYKTQLQRTNSHQTQFQGVNFFGAKCQDSNFHKAQCQGVNFYGTQLQGVKFSETQFQGACAAPFIDFNLQERIGENTELDNITFAGEIDENKPKSYKISENSGIITGVLKDSEELQAIIKKDWAALEKLQKK